MAKVEASYSGKWPNRCSGRWTLIVDGVDVSDKIPENLRENHDMNTYGTYERRFLGRRGTRCETYEDGLELAEWVEENREWLSSITEDEDTWDDIFEAINEQDFRKGCCGGCI